MRPWKAGWLPAGVSQSASQRHQAPSRNQNSKAAAASSARPNDSSQELVATGAPDTAASQQRSLSQAAPTAAATAAASAPAQPEQQQQQLVVPADGAQPGQPPPAGRGLLGAPGRFALQRAGGDGAAAAPKRVRKLLPATRSAGDDEDALTPLAAGASQAHPRGLHIRRDYGVSAGLLCTSGRAVSECVTAEWVCWLGLVLLCPAVWGPASFRRTTRHKVK